MENRQLLGLGPDARIHREQNTGSGGSGEALPKKFEGVTGEAPTSRKKGVIKNNPPPPSEPHEINAKTDLEVLFDAAKPTGGDQLSSPPKQVEETASVATPIPGAENPVGEATGTTVPTDALPITEEAAAQAAAGQGNEASAGTAPEVAEPAREDAGTRLERLLEEQTAERKKNDEAAKKAAEQVLARLTAEEEKKSEDERKAARDAAEQEAARQRQAEAPAEGQENAVAEQQPFNIEEARRELNRLSGTDAIPMFLREPNQAARDRTRIAELREQIGNYERQKALDQESAQAEEDAGNTPPAPDQTEEIAAAAPGFMPPPEQTNTGSTPPSPEEPDLTTPETPPDISMIEDVEPPRVEILSTVLPHTLRINSSNFSPGQIMDTYAHNMEMVIGFEQQSIDIDGAPIIIRTPGVFDGLLTRINDQLHEITEYGADLRERKQANRFGRWHLFGESEEVDHAKKIKDKAVKKFRTALSQRTKAENALRKITGKMTEQDVQVYNTQRQLVQATKERDVNGIRSAFEALGRRATARQLDRVESVDEALEIAQETVSQCTTDRRFQQFLVLSTNFDQSESTVTETGQQVEESRKKVLEAKAKQAQYSKDSTAARKMGKEEIALRQRQAETFATIGYIQDRLPPTPQNLERAGGISEQIRDTQSIISEAGSNVDKVKAVLVKAGKGKKAAELGREVSTAIAELNEKIRRLAWNIESLVNPAIRLTTTHVEKHGVKKIVVPNAPKPLYEAAITIYASPASRESLQQLIDNQPEEKRPYYQAAAILMGRSGSEEVAASPEELSPAPPVDRDLVEAGGEIPADRPIPDIISPFSDNTGSQKMTEPTAPAENTVNNTVPAEISSRLFELVRGNADDLRRLGEAIVSRQIGNVIDLEPMTLAAIARWELGIDRNTLINRINQAMESGQLPQEIQEFLQSGNVIIDLVRQLGIDKIQELANTITTNLNNEESPGKFVLNGTVIERPAIAAALLYNLLIGSQKAIADGSATQENIDKKFDLIVESLFK